MGMIPPRPVYPTVFEQETCEGESLSFDERLLFIEQHGLDTAWFECFWNALVTGVTTLWNALESCVRAIPGMHTPSSTWPSSRQSNTALLALIKAIEDEIHGVVDIDYEQPQTMYPELPKMEHES